MASAVPDTPAPHAPLILTGLMLGVLLYALDQTVVGTSLPKIVASVGGFEHFSWLFAAYMLASTTVIPLAGKFSDVYGRRPIFLGGMGLFLVGSALCGTADTMGQLIAYRAIQGLGGGSIFPVALATIADLYPPSERGRIQGIFGAAWGLASVAGPFLGGWIVDYVHVWGIESWRWVFYVNLPLGAVAIAMVARHFPRTPRVQGLPLDHAGIATLTLALLSGLLVTVWGGDAYAWASPQIIGLAALAAAALAAFLRIETRAVDPVMPLTLFRDPVFAVSSAAVFLMGAGMFAVITFMPTYMQGVVGVSATYSGAALVPLSLAIVTGSIWSGRAMKRSGYKTFTLAGTGIAAVGFLLLSRLGVHPPLWVAVVEMAVLGLGIGFTLQTYIVAVQNATPRRFMGVATSSITLLRTLGATMGVTVLGVVLNRRLATEIPARVEPGMLQGMLANPLVGGRVERVPSLLLSPEAVEGLLAVPGGEAAIEGIKAAFTEGVSLVFLAGLLLAFAAFLVTLALRSLPLKDRAAYDAAPEAEASAHAP